MLIVGAEINGQGPLDLRCEQGVISAIAPTLPAQAGEPLIHAQGGALLPGLHDHHLHLFALAARRHSIDCGPPHVNNAQQLAQALREAKAKGSWVRGLSYHESVAGELDRYGLDKIISEHALRLQHRSGKLWILNSLACERLGLDKQSFAPEIERGIERDGAGHATGRLFRLDRWLGAQVQSLGDIELAPLSAQMARYGLSGLSDASPSNNASTLALFERAAEQGQLQQRLHLMGSLDLPQPTHWQLSRGPVKLLLDDYQLPAFEDFCQHIGQAHDRGRAVAIHCVTQTELIFALSALQQMGAIKGDRIEHASVCPDEALPLMRDSGVCVVTQYGFIRERGDQYLEDVEVSEQKILYRGRSFLEAEIPLAASSDAPYGSVDPWQAMAAAVRRLTLSGKSLGDTERLSPEQALALFTGKADSPGGPTRRIEVGAAADLCLLDCPWSQARQDLDSRHVRATLVAGEPIYQRAHPQQENRLA